MDAETIARMDAEIRETVEARKAAEAAYLDFIEECAAVHEFAHVLTAALLDVRFYGAGIVTRDDMSGFGGGIALVEPLERIRKNWAKRGYSISPQNLDARQAEIVILMAGAAAERIMFGADYECFGFESDWEKVAALVKSESEEIALWEYTCELLFCYREVLEAGALMLRDYGRLNGSELKTIITALREERMRLAETS
jgi:hypothetical protein